MTESARALIYTAPGIVQLRTETLAPAGTGLLDLATLWSGLSRGTERLVFQGRVPRSEWERMRAPFQEGDFPFPVKYGYAAVARVEAGPPDLLGRVVFALAPHQDRLRLPESAVVPLPEGVPPERAVLAANAETALNAIWDAELVPGSRVLVVGAGLLGSLIAAFLSLRIDLNVSVVDPVPDRAHFFADFCVTCLTTARPGAEYDVAFHTSATAAGLRTALDALAFEGRVIELSWYGDRPVEVALGGAFHSRRLSIVASQVGHVAQSRRASHSYRDRLALALGMLTDPRLDRLITAEVAFEDLPAAMEDLLADGAQGIATRIRYE